MTLLPHPIVTVVIALLWMVLTSFTLGQLVLGALAGLLGGLAYRRITPERIMVKRPGAMARLFVRVAGDIVRSNYAVASLIVTRGRHGRRRSGFVRIPLDLTSPSGLSVLAKTFVAPVSAWVPPWWLGAVVVGHNPTMEALQALREKLSGGGS